MPRILAALKPQPLNSSRVHLDGFVRAAAGSVPAGALVLDAGAGDGPYREHFAAHRYESTDFEMVAKRDPGFADAVNRVHALRAQGTRPQHADDDI